MEDQEGAPVQAAGLDQEPRHGSIGAALDHLGAGADDAVRARPHPAGESQPGEPRADLALSPGDPAGAARASADDCRGSRCLGRHGVAGDAAGGRVHAQPRRGHLVLYAGDLARPVDHQVGRAAADPEQDHQVVSRGRLGVRQGRPRRPLRPIRRRTRNVRDRDQPQAQGGVAGRHDHGQADCRARPRAAVPRVSNAWTMPIKARIDMLATGIRTAGRPSSFWAATMPSWKPSPARSRRRSTPCPAPPRPMPSG